MRKLILSSALLTIVACAPGFKPSYSTLADQGILGLSTTNAYLASNLFLGREAERSPYLYNFLKAKGAPTAIEIMESGFSRPRLLLFYPTDREVYFSEPEIVDQKPQWITRGPFPIDWKDYRVLAGLNTSLVGEAVFVIRGEEEKFRFKSNEPKPQRFITPLLAPTPAPTIAPKHKAKIIVAKKDSEEKKAEPGPGIKDWKPLNADQMALYMSKGFAERDENGDVLHTVLGSKETLEAITKWYTGSAANLKTIGTINIASEQEFTAPLEPGRKVRIPVSLLKELKAMPPGN